MASEYSVNISLDTKKAEANLRNLKKGIDGLTAKKGGAAKKELSAEEQLLKIENQQLTIKNRGLGLTLKALPLEQKGVNIKKVEKKIRAANVAASQEDFDLAKKNLLLADKRIKKAQVLLKKNQDTAKTAKKASFDPSRVNIGAGQAPMNINTVLAQSEKRLGFEVKLRELESQGVKTAKLRAKMGELVDARNRKEFGSIDRINRQIRMGIKFEQSKLRLLAKQNAERVKEDKFIQRQVANVNKLANEFGRLGISVGKFQDSLINTRGPGGSMLALPSAQMLDQRVKATGQAGGFSRNIPRFRLPSPTRGFDFGSALISGGFPLLFGQGPVGALAGGLGGGIGGMFGQMGGFAGGIAATAIVQQLQNTIAAVSQLGQAFNSINPNIEALTASLGVAGTEEERRLKLIEETQGKQAALAAVTENMNKAIGVDGVANLKKFGETSQLLANAFTLAMTKMQAALAPLFELLATPFAGPIKAQQRAEQIAAGGGATDATLLGLQEQLEGIASTKQNRARRKRLEAQIEARKQELAELGKIEITAKNIRMIEDSKLKKIRQQNDLLRAKINGNFEEVKLAQEVEAKIHEMVEAGAKINEIDKQRVEDTMKLNKDLEKQAELAEKIRQSFKDLGQSIATDISDGIKGMIRGTSTLNDLLNNVMDKLIDTAFNMAFFGNPMGQMGSGGLFGSIFSGIGSMFNKGPFGGAPLGPKGNPLSQHTSLVVGERAGGGSVKAGSGYLVGERGPELFTPGVSGMVTPNHALGGSTNIVVNVDASSSSVEGDEEQGRELGRMISVAIQSELIKQKRPGGMLA